jgi:hypothetical protein
MDRASFSDIKRGAVLLAAGILAVAAFAPSGCGLPGEADSLFGGGQDNAAGSGGGATTGTTSASASSGGPTTSSQTSSSTGEGGATTSSSSSSTGEGGAGGAGGAATTSTSSGPAPTIDCGMVECPQGGANACCWDEHMFNRPPYGVCVDSPPGDCNTAIQMGGVETRISCQTPEHCPGALCCAQRDDFMGPNNNQIFYYVNVTCQNECDYNQDQRILCDMANPSCPTIQINGNQVQLACVTSGLLPPGYSVCAIP